ncbi:MAG: limonene-1,2-epoxide hydrolase family protein [Polyangiaceae bacterium]|jgi:limonene-1,2-epoxide hydrolase
MQTETNTAATASSPIEVVQDFLHTLERKDLDRAASYLADDVVYQNVPLPADRGKPAVLRTLRAFQRFVTDFEVRMRHIAENDGVVLTERVDVLSGPLVYLDIWVCGTFEVRGGRITLWRDYFDLAVCSGKLLVGPIRKLLRRGR